MTGHAPGVYDIPEAEYFADPALSCSGAKLLLPPSCPALFRYRQDHPEHKDVFDQGSAAHRMVLGAGPDIALVEAPDWRGKAAREAKEAAYTEGKTPLLYADAMKIAAMAGVVRQHPVAGALLDPERGEPERSLFWVDEDTGVHRRARLDWWLPTGDFGRVIAVDYKTCTSADPGVIAKAVANYGYYMQDAWYTDGIRALFPDHDDPAFVFVFQEKEPPYLVTVAQLDDDARAAGRARNRQAIERFRDCIEADSWPGYSDDIAYISLPPWAARSMGVNA